MKTFAITLAAATVALTSTSFAQNRVYDPAAGDNDPRFIYESSETASLAAGGNSAISTNDSDLSTVPHVRVYNPAAGDNDPRFVLVRVVDPASTSAISTNDGSLGVTRGKSYFGINLDRAVESKNSPYDN
jgi:hypothetical protein